MLATVRILFNGPRSRFMFLFSFYRAFAASRIARIVIVHRYVESHFPSRFAKLFPRVNCEILITLNSRRWMVTDLKWSNVSRRYLMCKRRDYIKRIVKIKGFILKIHYYRISVIHSLLYMQNHSFLREYFSIQCNACSTLKTWNKFGNMIFNLNDKANYYQKIKSVINTE